MFGDKDDDGENMVDLDEIVELRFDPHREPKESDYEHILSMTRQGYQSGQFDSGVDYQMKQKQIVHYNCPFGDFSTWNRYEDYEGEALQHVKNHLRSWHKRTDLDGQIKETVD